MLIYLTSWLRFFINLAKVLYRNAFRYYQMGYASALALLMLIVLLLLALLLARSSSLWVYYEAGERA